MSGLAPAGRAVAQYRQRAGGMENIKRILTHLQQRHANFFVKMYLQVMLGLVLSLMAPAAAFFFTYVLAWCWGKNLPWGWGMLIATAVVWPLLFRFEIQT